MNPWAVMQRFGPSTSGGGPVDPIAVAIISKLISWWEMSEVSGTRNDSKGTNNLNVEGTVSTGTGVRGGADVAAAFAGAGGLSVLNNTTINLPSGGGSHCMFGWVYLSANTGGQTFFSKWDNGTTTSSGMEYQGDLSGGNFRGINGGSTYYSASTTAPAAGAWHFYVMWRDSADGKVRMQLDNGTIYVSASASNPSQNFVRLYFGRDYANTARMTGRLQRWGWIKGDFLTATERTWIYNSGSGRTYAEILAAAGM